MTLIDKIRTEQLKANTPDFRPGDTIRVHQLIMEGGKERVQIFEGVVTRRTGGGINENFTVRKVSYNVGVERIFPLHSPRVVKIEVKQKGSVRRARLYYLSSLRGKAARIKQAMWRGELESTPVQDADVESPSESASPEA